MELINSCRRVLKLTILYSRTHQISININIKEMPSQQVKHMTKFFMLTIPNKTLSIKLVHHL